MHVVEEMLRLSSIFWILGQTLLLKTEMGKPPSHGQFVQDTSKINILLQYTTLILSRRIDHTQTVVPKTQS